jgi:hypothetical protein
VAGKIDAAHKLSVIAALLMAASGAAYYYAFYLPDRDARLDREHASATLLAYGERRVAEERSDAERRRLAQQRAADKAVAGIRYRSCLNNARTHHQASWAEACKRLADQAAQARADCLAKENLSQAYCNASYRTLDGSAHCTLPVEIAADIDGDLNAARNHCLREREAALQ